MDDLRTAIEAYPGRQVGIAEVLGITQGAVSHWLTGRSKPRAEDVARIESLTGISRHLLRPDVFGPAPSADDVLPAAAFIDSRMSKRALRARLGLSTDKQLAKVLQLPVEQVEGWEEERALPAVPEVLRLLGAQAPAAAAAPQEPEDPDAARIVPVETA